MRIDGYSFGVMTIGGRAYQSDLVAFPDRVSPNWRRREGHVLGDGDLKEVLAYGPDALIVGTGAYGVMRVPGGVRSALEARGFEMVISRTGEAIGAFNERIERGERVVGAFHLTC
jgi:hypothetical protein